MAAAAACVAMAAASVAITHNSTRMRMLPRNRTGAPTPSGVMQLTHTHTTRPPSSWNSPRCQLLSALAMIGCKKQAVRCGVVYRLQSCTQLVPLFLAQAFSTIFLNFADVTLSFKQIVP